MCEIHMQESIAFKTQVGKLESGTIKIPSREATKYQKRQELILSRKCIKAFMSNTHSILQKYVHAYTHMHTPTHTHTCAHPYASTHKHTHPYACTHSIIFLVEKNHQDSILVMCTFNRILIKAKQNKTKHPNNPFLPDVISLWPQANHFSVLKIGMVRIGSFSSCLCRIRPAAH